MHIGSQVALFGPTLLVVVTTVLGVLLSSLAPEVQKVGRSIEAESSSSAVVLRVPDAVGTSQEASEPTAASDVSGVSADEDMEENSRPVLSETTARPDLGKEAADDARPSPEKTDAAEAATDKGPQDNLAQEFGQAVASSPPREAEASPDADVSDDTTTVSAGPSDVKDADSPQMAAVGAEDAPDASSGTTKDKRGSAPPEASMLPDVTEEVASSVEPSPEKSDAAEASGDRGPQGTVAQASDQPMEPSSLGEAEESAEVAASDEVATELSTANGLDARQMAARGQEGPRDALRGAATEVPAQAAQAGETSTDALPSSRNVDETSTDESPSDFRKDVPTLEGSQVAARSGVQATGLPDAALNRAVAAAPTTPQDLLIMATVRQQLNTPERRQGAHPDDLAALEEFYAQHSGPVRWLTSAGLTPEAKEVVAEISRAGEWGLDPEAFALPSADFRGTDAAGQADTEILIDLAILKYARAARGGRAGPSAVSKLFDQKLPLHEPRQVLDAVSVVDLPKAYLRDLHPKHPQFEALRQALLGVRSQGGSAEAEVQKLLVNMERWRWMPENLGEYHVWANIPEFELHVVKDNKKIASEKMVVGNPKTPTPVLSADLKSVVFNPERVVPLSVIRRDVLPKLQKSRGWMSQRDASVLDQYQLTVKNKGRTLNPRQIDWKKVNLSRLTFVQAPGPKNILGKVQFLYPNSRGVFMHDTIIPSQLSREVRVAGPPNPRVANPDRLAAVLLEQGKGWSKPHTDKTAKKENAKIVLDKPIPVHTTYFTAVVDDEGKLKTFDDIYELDGAVEKLISGRAPTAVGTTEATSIPSRKPGAKTGASSVDR